MAQLGQWPFPLLRLRSGSFNLATRQGQRFEHLPEQGIKLVLINLKVLGHASILAATNDIRPRSVLRIGAPHVLRSLRDRLPAMSKGPWF
jgi:hypothetical protein